MFTYLFLIFFSIFLVWRRHLRCCWSLQPQPILLWGLPVTVIQRTFLASLSRFLILFYFLLARNIDALLLMRTLTAWSVPIGYMRRNHWRLHRSLHGIPHRPLRSHHHGSVTHEVVLLVLREELLLSMRLLNRLLLLLKGQHQPKPWVLIDQLSLDLWILYILPEVLGRGRLEEVLKVNEGHVIFLSLVIGTPDKIDLTHLTDILLVKDIGNALLADICKYARNEN